MNKPLTFLLALTFLFLFGCSDQKAKTKVKQIENPKVKESFENDVTSVINSLDMKKMKEWGFAPNYDFPTGKFDDELKIKSMQVLFKKTRYCLYKLKTT